MFRAVWRILVFCAVFGCLSGCRTPADAPNDPLLAARPAMEGKAGNDLPPMLAVVEPAPPLAPLELQDRPSIALKRPLPGADPNLADLPASPTSRRPNGILTNRPKAPVPLPQYQP